MDSNSFCIYTRSQQDWHFNFCWDRDKDAVITLWSVRYRNWIMSWDFLGFLIWNNTNLSLLVELMRHVFRYIDHFRFKTFTHNYISGGFWGKCLCLIEENPERIRESQIPNPKLFNSDQTGSQKRSRLALIYRPSITRWLSDYDNNF
jgi:hypothetical protein